MSRIDEALRRASALSGAARPGSPAVSPSAGLDDYVVEREGGRGADRRDEAGRSERSDNGRTLTALGRRLAHRVLGISSAPADAVEHYRRLAALMYEAQVERGLKTLLMTSAVPREGKTTTACNLAAALSESYRQRVLLIDADLRRPSVHEVFGIPNVNGLGDALQSDVRNARIVSVSSRLSVLPAGRPSSDPVAGLSSGRMATVLREASGEFDWVLLDTPPVGLLPDAQHIVRMADAVLMVIAAGTTPYTLVQRAVAEVGPDRIIGTVLNRVQEGAIPMTSYYKHYYGSLQDASS